MKLLKPEVLNVLKQSALPGTVFVEVDSFTAKNNHNHKVVLAITKRDIGWGNPVYVMVMEIKDEVENSTWCINPWLNVELIERFLKLPTPERAMARIPQDIIAQLVEGLVSTESAINDVISVIGGVVKEYGESTRT
jgi:hypothetical protein